MALEDLTGPNKFISNLVPANPPSTDPASQGSDHIQGIKNVLQNTFPGMAGPYAFGPSNTLMTWNTGGVVRMRLGMTGEIGIGGTGLTNNGKLQVTQELNPYGIEISAASGGVNTGAAIMRFLDSNNTVERLIISANSDTSQSINAAATLDLKASGATKMSITATSGVIVQQLAGSGIRPVYSDQFGILTNSSSDSTLKESVNGLTQGLDAVMAMRPISFYWVDKEKRGTQKEIGFIAQEMAQIVPEVVGSNADDTLSLDYAKLVAVMAKAIQELKAEVDALKAR